MSWSVSYIGTPEKVVDSLEKYIETTHLSGPSKDEFEAALPHLVGIVKQNFGNENCLLKLSAHGHGYSVDGKITQSTCAVNVETLYGVLV